MSRNPHRAGARRLLAVPVAAAVAVVLASSLAACGDDDDGGESIADEAGQLADSAGALAVAEALRGVLVAEDLGDDAQRRDIAVLREAVDDLPGNPDVAGIADADGDGRDDDGRVEVRVGGEAACLAIAPSGDTDVHDRAC